jgi:hypothetical protein
MQTNYNPLPETETNPVILVRVERAVQTAKEAYTKRLLAIKQR